MSTLPDFFHFAIPRDGDREARELAPAYIAGVYGVTGRIEHVRSEERFHLYRVRVAK